MASNAGVIQAELSVQIGTALSQLKEASAAITQLGQSAGAGMLPAKRAIDETSSVTQRFTKVLGEFKAEQVQQARQAKFFAGSIASIIPVAAGAQEALQGLLSVGLEGLAGGAGIGLAIEAVGFLGSQIQKVVGAEEAAKKKAIEWGVEMRKQLVSMIDKTQELRDKLANVTPVQKAQRVATNTEAAVARLEAEKKEIEDRQQWMLDNQTTPTARTYTASAGIGGGLSPLMADRQRLKEINEGIADAGTKSLGVLKAEAKEAREHVVLAQQERDKEMASLSARLEGETRLLAATTQGQRIEAEYKNAAIEANIEYQNGVIDEPQRLAKVVLAEQKRVLALREQVALNRELRDTQLQAGMGGFEDTRLTLSPEETKRLDADAEKTRLQGIEDSADKSGSTGFEDERLVMSTEERTRLAKDAMKSFNAEVDKSNALGEQWGGVFGNALTGLVQGTLSLGQAFAQVAQEIVKSLIQIAIQAVTANAASAASGAASSQAAIPIFGPALGIAAMGAMLGAVLGLLGSIGAKELGGSVFGGRSYLVGEAGPELLRLGGGISGSIIPNHALAMGSAAGAGVGSLGNVNINITAFDSQDVERALNKHDSVLYRVITRGARAGRV